MMKTKSLSFFLLLLALILVLTSCSSNQPGVPATPETIPTPTFAEPPPTEVPPTEPPPPTNTLPVPTDTPETVPLTETSAAGAPTEPPTSEPTVPPSTLQLAYLNIATDIVLWKESDLTVTTLVPASGAIDLRLSGDGTMLAYRKEIDIGQQELWVVNTDGSDARMLLSVEALRALDPDALGVFINQYEWIPGTADGDIGHTIAFNTAEYVEAPGVFLYDDLYFLEAVGENAGEFTVQLTPGTGGHFVFSPDGRQYAVITPETISLLNTDGTNIRPDVLTYPYVLTYSEYEFYAEPVWSPDSSFLRVAIPPQDSLGEPEAPTLLWEIPTDGSPAFQLGEVVAQPFFIDPVLYSPDLTHIAYTRLSEPEDYANAALVIASFDGSGETIIETGNLFFLGWAPDSEHFVFESFETGETYLGTLTGEYELLTDVPSTSEIHWLDDTRFLFLVETSRGWQMRLGELGAGSVVFLELPGAFPIFDFDN